MDEFPGGLLQGILPGVVGEVSVGVFSILVRADRENGSTCWGMASTLYPRRCGGEFPGVRFGGELLGMELKRAAALLKEEDPLSAATGLAVLNSTWNCDSLSWREVNARELFLEKGRGQRVAAVGHFPFLDEMKKDFAHLDIFELEPGTGEHPPAEMAAYLPRARVVLLTGTVIANHTFPAIRQWLNPESFVIMVGPSTPLVPVLFRWGVDALCGTRVVDPRRLLLQVRQGVPYRRLEGVQRVALLKRDWLQSKTDVAVIRK